MVSPLNVFVLLEDIGDQTRASSVALMCEKVSNENHTAPTTSTTSSDAAYLSSSIRPMILLSPIRLIGDLRGHLALLRHLLPLADGPALVSTKLLRHKT